MTIDEILMLPDHEINYRDLDSGTLLALATQNEEPFIATSALGQLSQRCAPEVKEAALAILAGDWADRHLRAFAITTLFDADSERALVEMTRLVDQTDDPLLLGAMVQCVLADLDDFRTANRQAFTRGLAERVAAVAPDEFTDIEDRTFFLDNFQLPGR